MASGIVAALASGCCKPYVEPPGLSGELAHVRGVASIDDACVESVGTVAVTPGPHVVHFAVPSAAIAFPVTSRSGPGSLWMAMNFEAGHQYHFEVKTYLDGSRLLMHNLTTDRKTYLDPERMIYYDDSNQLLSRPEGPYSP